MNGPEQRYKELFHQWCSGIISGEETRLLFQLLREADERGELEPLLQEAYQQVKEEEIFSPEAIQQMANTITGRGNRVVRINVWRKIAVAASVLLVLGAGYYFLFPGKKSGAGEIAKTEVLPSDVKAPQLSKAVLQLEDGQTILLDSLQSLTRNGVVISKKDGEVIYSGSASKTVYNKLVNPRGSPVVQLSLSDGTKVWLNSESSLSYPAVFTGATREVDISGEAYFEVAKDARRKFIVRSGGVSTEVLGTHFNVNSYPDASAIQITLLEGSVEVKKGNAKGLLQPGEQAQIADKIKVVPVADPGFFIAWKEGQFRFRETPISQIMREVARWYDVEIVYQGNLSHLRFGGSVSRQANVSELLKRLEATETVRFKIEGKKITVMAP